LDFHVQFISPHSHNNNIGNSSPDDPKQLLLRSELIGGLKVCSGIPEAVYGRPHRIPQKHFPVTTEARTNAGMASNESPAHEEGLAPETSSPGPLTSNPHIDNIPAAALEAGDDTETDDGYSSGDAGSTTTSLSSSIRAHVWENGRRYNKFREGQYALPNDEGEQAREDMKHAVTLMLCNGALHFAPIGENPQNIIE